jgi:hypothetical protein
MGKTFSALNHTDMMAAIKDATLTLAIEVPLGALWETPHIPGLTLAAEMRLSHGKGSAMQQNVRLQTPWREGRLACRMNTSTHGKMDDMRPSCDTNSLQVSGRCRVHRHGRRCGRHISSALHLLNNHLCERRMGVARNLAASRRVCSDGGLKVPPRRSKVFGFGTLLEVRKSLFTFSLVHRKNQPLSCSAFRSPTE